MPTTRARRREDVTARVLEIGRQHLAEHGAAGLSLRAVTRDLGMVSSAVYRYVANRDELLTLLLVDAYGAQADAVDAAVDAAADQPLVTCGCSPRRTRSGPGRCAEPSRYALLYGSPVPGYAAPAEVTIEPGTRVIGTLLAPGGRGGRRGRRARPAGAARPARAAGRRPAGRRGRGRPGHRTRPCCRGRLLLWSTVVGGTSLEVFGQYGADTFRDPRPGLRPAGPDGARRAARRPRRPDALPDSAISQLRPLPPRRGGDSQKSGQRPAATRARWARTTASTRAVGNSSR